ncbi:MAG: hypothetical protein JWP15_244 [Alphaproteobacteria bacterium]|nr:hypothetical protein [Alphaproteobacteria bacterium]
MIFKRAVAKLKAQDWMAIGIEIVIVVIGVFIGTQVSNWNNARIERGKTEQLARDLQPELRNQAENYRQLIDYYSVTRRYGDTAFAGWRNDPQVSDRDFVIAAYQASQNLFSGTNTASWGQIFGSDRLRDLENPRLREPLSILMTTDLAAFEKDLSTDYRRDVRMVIGEDVQDAIRARCGDRRVGLNYIGLPRTCTLDLPEARFTETAKALRANPKLAGELRYHFAIVATYVEILRELDDLTRAALQQIKRA